MSPVKKLRVVHVIESLGRGGLETFVCDLIAAQLDVIDVHVICIYEAGVLEQRLTALGIKPQLCEKSRDGLFKGLFRLRRYLNAISPDVIHTHNEIPNYYAVWATRLFKKTTILNTRHNMGIAGPNNRKERLFRTSMANTRYMVACSKAVKVRFAHVFGIDEEKIKVIPNGIPVEKLQLPNKSEARQNWRSSNGFTDSNIVVCAVGRLSSVKNHSGLLDAFSKIANPHARLVLVGDGPLMGDLVQKASALGIEKRVLFTGDSSEIPTLLASVDIFTLPSLSEAHSIALLEAATAGLAVVASNVGGNPEVIENGKNGFLVEPGDVAGLTQKLDVLINDPTLRTEFAQQLRAWALENADIKMCAQHYLKLYATQ